MKWCVYVVPVSVKFWDVCLAYGILVVHNNMKCECLDSKVKEKRIAEKMMKQSQTNEEMKDD